ncbi:MAG TPA: hypothetical protein VJC13_01385 [Candidatus Paceibacterota bacterium]
MLTKTKNFLGFPNVKKVKRGTFFELASKHIIKSKKKSKTTLSQDIDSILYGK